MDVTARYVKRRITDGSGFVTPPPRISSEHTRQTKSFLVTDGSGPGSKDTPPGVAAWSCPVCFSMGAKQDRTGSVKASSFHIGEGFFISSWHNKNEFREHQKHIFSGHNKVGHGDGNYFPVDDSRSVYIDAKVLDLCFLKVCASPDDLPVGLDSADEETIHRAQSEEECALLIGYGARDRGSIASETRSDVLVRLVSDDSSVPGCVAAYFEEQRGPHWRSDYLVAVSHESRPANFDSGAPLVIAGSNEPLAIGAETLSITWNEKDGCYSDTGYTYSLYAKASRFVQAIES